MLRAARKEFFMRTNISETDAKQGTERKGQRKILLVSTALAAAVLAIALIGFAIAF